MRVRLFVEFEILDYDEKPGLSVRITDEQYTHAAKECVQTAMLRAYEVGAAHSLEHCCSVGPALVFGARIVHNNADIPSAARALVNAVECQLREDELAKAKLNAETLLRRLATSGMSPLELNVAYATLDALVYPLTGQHVNTNMEEPHERPNG